MCHRDEISTLLMIYVVACATTVGMHACALDHRDESFALFMISTMARSPKRDFLPPKTINRGLCSRPCACTNASPSFLPLKWYTPWLWFVPAHSEGEERERERERERYIGWEREREREHRDAQMHNYAEAKAHTNMQNHLLSHLGQTYHCNDGMPTQ